MARLAPTSGALAHLVLAAAGLVEVGDGRQLGPDRPAAEPAVVEVLAGLLGVLLVAELDVRVAGQVLAQVVADVHLLDLAVLVLHLEEELLEDAVEVGLHLLRVVRVEHLVVPRVHGRAQRVDVQVLEQHGLRERRLVVHFRALLAVPARADLEEERAVHLVLLRAEYRRQVVRHPLSSSPLKARRPRQCFQ